jgi:hypothetical protein
MNMVHIIQFITYGMHAHFFCPKFIVLKQTRAFERTLAYASRRYHTSTSMAATQNATTAITSTVPSNVAAQHDADGPTVATSASAWVDFSAPSASTAPTTKPLPTGDMTEPLRIVTGPWDDPSMINCRVILPQDVSFCFANIHKDADIPWMHFTRKMYDEKHDVEYHALHRLMRKEYNVLTFCIDEVETRKARDLAIAAKWQAVADAEDAQTQVLVD